MTKNIFIFTHLTSLYTQEFKHMELPWDEWAKLLTRHVIRPEKAGPSIILGPSSGRKQTDVIETQALALDIEKQNSGEIAKAFEALAPFEYVAYTTHSHRPNETRLRVIIPLAHSIPPERHAVIWSRLNMLVDGINDPSTKNINRIHYLPSSPKQEWAHAQRNKTGRFLAESDLPQHIQDTGGIADDVIDKQKSVMEIGKIRRRMRSIENDSDLKEMAKQVLAKEPFAQEGSRHDAIKDFTWWLASNEDPPNLQTVWEIFQPSIAQMKFKDPEWDGEREVHRLYRDALTKLRNEKESRVNEKQLDGAEAYTEEDIQRLAKIQNCPLDEFQKRWIIQRDVNYYFLQSDGYYTSPRSEREARVAATRTLARAAHTVRLFEANRSGLKRRGIGELVEDYGSLAEGVVADMTIQGSYFNHKNRIIYEATCPRRDIGKPREDEVIAKWLSLLGGNQQNKLLDWLACAPNPNKSLCAIYLQGPPGSGKTLLAYALAKIWTDGQPTPIEALIEAFNEELSRCPVVLADETLPKSWKGQSITTRLRSELSMSVRPLTRKYRSTATLKGYLRLILSANNEFLLQGGDDVQTSADLKAISERFLYIKGSRAAADYLRTEVGQAYINDQWLNGEYRFARHVLWLEENREVQQTGRYWVEGSSEQSEVLAHNSMVELVKEWLVRYLCERPADRVIEFEKGQIIRGDGKLLVNSLSIAEDTTNNIITLGSRRVEVSSRNVAPALRILSKNDKTVQRSFKGKRRKYWEIDLKHLIQWAERGDIGDRETLIKAVSQKPRNERGMVPEEA